MNGEWDCRRLAAKATDREKAFRERWPAVEAQLRQWGYPSWGIAQAHLVLSSGGSVKRPWKRYAVTRRSLRQAALRRNGYGGWPTSRGCAHETASPAISKRDRPGRLDDCGPAVEQRRGRHRAHREPEHEP